MEIALLTLLKAEGLGSADVKVLSKKAEKKRRQKMAFRGGQGGAEPHTSSGGGGWDRVINPVHELGRSLLGFLVGGGGASQAPPSSSNPTRPKADKRGAAPQANSRPVSTHSSKNIDIPLDGVDGKKGVVRVPTPSAVAPKPVPPQAKVTSDPAMPRAKRKKARSKSGLIQTKFPDLGLVQSESVLRKGSDSTTSSLEVQSESVTENGASFNPNRVTEDKSTAAIKSHRKEIGKNKHNTPASGQRNNNNIRMHLHTFQNSTEVKLGLKII